MDKIRLPLHLQNIKSLDVKFQYDKFNILYLIIKHLFPKLASIKNYKDIPDKYLRKFNLKNFSFPLSFDDLKKFLRRNSHLPITLRILFESEGYVSNLGTVSNIKEKKNQEKNVLHLLMVKHDPEITPLFIEEIMTQLKDPHTKKNKSGFMKKVKIPTKYSNLNELKQQHHFFKIKNLRGFLNNRDRFLSKKKHTKLKYYYCNKCLLRFWSKTKKEKHERTCGDDQELEYPEENSVLDFDKQRHRFKAPVIGFCDFESVLQKNLNRSSCETCSQLECMCPFPASSDINSHRPVAFSILFVDSDNQVFFQEEYVGTDAAKVFLERLPEYEMKVKERKQKFKEVEKIKASQQDWWLYHKATTCHICYKPFDPSDWKKKKVPDHDHVSGKMVGPAHSLCNLFRNGGFHTPIYFHNAQG